MIRCRSKRADWRLLDHSDDQTTGFWKRFADDSDSCSLLSFSCSFSGIISGWRWDSTEGTGCIKIQRSSHCHCDSDRTYLTPWPFKKCSFICLAVIIQDADHSLWTFKQVNRRDDIVVLQIRLCFCGSVLIDVNVMTDGLTDSCKDNTEGLLIGLFPRFKPLFLSLMGLDIVPLRRWWLFLALQASSDYHWQHVKRRWQGAAISLTRSRSGSCEHLYGAAPCWNTQ